MADVRFETVVDFYDERGRCTVSGVPRTGWYLGMSVPHVEDIEATDENGVPTLLSAEEEHEAAERILAAIDKERREWTPDIA